MASPRHHYNSHFKPFALPHLFPYHKAKRLIKMEMKWKKIAAIGRKRLTSPRSIRRKMAEKGHFVVYAMDKKRFVIPLAYLKNSIFQELFKMSEEEFGLSSDEPITLLCDSVMMSYIILLVQRGLADYLEKQVLSSITGRGCSSRTTSFHEECAEKQSLISGF